MADQRLTTKSLFSDIPPHIFLLQLPLLRILRRWNQTGPPAHSPLLTYRPKIRRSTRYSQRISTTQPRHPGSSRPNNLYPRRVYPIPSLVPSKQCLQKDHLAHRPRQRIIPLQNLHGRRGRRTTSHMATTYPPLLVMGFHPRDESTSQFRSHGNGIRMVHDKLDSTSRPRLDHRGVSSFESILVRTDEIC